MMRISTHANRKTVGIIKTCQDQIDMPDSLYDEDILDWVIFYLQQYYKRHLIYQEIDCIMFNALCDYLNIVERPGDILQELRGMGNNVHPSCASKIAWFLQRRIYRNLIRYLQIK